MAETKPSSDVQRYLDIISDYDREFQKWEKRAIKITKRYRDETTITNSIARKKYPSLWTNIQTLLPAVYAKTPSPEVTRRFSDDDDVGRVAATILQRALEFEMKHFGDFTDTMMACIQDRLLSGRGTAWIRYDPEFEDAMVSDEDEETEETPQKLIEEKSPVDYVHWQDFGHNVARTWNEVHCVWRMVYMGRKSLINRFGEEVGRVIPLDASPPDPLNVQTKKLSGDKKALIYEIWDKDEETVCWINKSHAEILDEVDDPLGLEGFFPCPKPIYATMTSDSLVPVPDYVFYQDQAEALDLLQVRIDGLIQALKVQGVYDASVPELKRLFTEGSNTQLIPVPNYGALSEKGGLKGAVDLVPIDLIAATLEQSFTAQKALKDEINYITGLADIVHGVGDAGETATAQGIKGNYVGLRLNCSQGQVAQFASDIIRIKAQIVATYQPEILLEISSANQLSQDDQQLIPQALQLIANKPLRTFRIEVDADSMVNLDESQEKADRVEFIGAFSQLFGQAAPLVGSNPEVAPIVIEIMKYGIGAYKGAKSIEGQLDSMLDQIAKTEQAQVGQPKPNPKLQEIQAQGQIQLQGKQQELQLQSQVEQQKMQMQMQLEQHKQQMQAQQVTQQNQIEAQRDTLKMQQDAALEQQKQHHESALQQQEMEFDKYKAELDASTKIIIAEIAAQTQANQQLLQAESDAAQKESEDLGGEKIDQMAQMHKEAMDKITGVMEKIAKPKTIVRGPDGKAVGVQ